jgi:hypothetical protein
MKKSKEETKKKEWDILNNKLEELQLNQQDKDKLKREFYQKEIQIYRLM